MIFAGCEKEWFEVYLEFVTVSEWFKRKECGMNYQEADLVRVARRENNRKRNYLVINRLQGKHIPVRPQEALAMFQALADRGKEEFSGERLLVIGFAETATAIGAAVAERLDAFYMHTTRENVQGADYLYFSEDHSHATQQKLVKNDLDQIISKVDRIVFAEDEVTTGNTILHIIDLLQKEYPGQVCYAVMSILNGMEEQALLRYEKRQIPLYYLLKTDHSSYVQKAEQYKEPGTYLSCQNNGKLSGQVKQYHISGWLDARRLTTAFAYKQACIHLWHETDKKLHSHLSGNVLVLGTEEFMYPALFAAAQIEKNGANVRFHASTRSPIAVYKEDAYPLHVRYELQSPYEQQRRTFLYDIGVYDSVLIFTDAQTDISECDALCQAVAVNNKNIYLVRWGK